MTEWEQAQQNLKRVTSDRGAYEAERERVIGLLESGQAKDMKAAAKWLNKIDAVYNGIYSYEEVATGKAKVSDVYIPKGTPINSESIKEIKRQVESGETVIRVSNTSSKTAQQVSTAVNKVTSSLSLPMVSGNKESNGLIWLLVVIILLLK